MKLQIDPKDPEYKTFVRDVAQNVVAIMDERKPIEEPKPIEKPKDEDEILTIREVHNITGIKSTTLRKHVKCNPPLLKSSRPGKHYLVRRSDLNEYLNRNKK